jgi:hypothetical protein
MSFKNADNADFKNNFLNFKYEENQEKLKFRDLSSANFLSFLDNPPKMARVRFRLS